MTVVAPVNVWHFVTGVRVEYLPVIIVAHVVYFAAPSPQRHCAPA